jgi:signal transduction histidine kinase
LTLTTRLSLFFLGTLAVVLAGFSIGLYLLARIHLHRQLDERLEASLNTLVAAAELGPEGLEWEPAERHLRLGSALGDRVVWLVADEHGQVVDRSQQAGAEDFLAEAGQALRTGARSTKRLDWQGERWQCSQRWLDAAGVDVTRPARPPQPGPKNDDGKYRALSITAGVSLEPVRATLRQLAGVLIALSVGVWLVAMFAGRAVCRRALMPVSRMAAAAREMNADLEQRLATAGSGDELEDLSRAFNSLLDRLQESFERQRRFSGDASHQLRTPLAVILGQIDVTLRRERPGAEYQRVLAMVRERAGHLTQIVEALLFLSRADAEARLPQRERIDLNQWLPAHLQSWWERERGKDMVFECDGAKSNNVDVQPALLGELLDILIDNACKYSPPGTAITVRLRQEQQTAFVQVEDQGSGIAEADLPYLFTPFFRAAETRRRGIAGLGLGLSIARRLAEAFGGDLTLSSGIGGGSLFTLRLPQG